MLFWYTFFVYLLQVPKSCPFLECLSFGKWTIFCRASLSFLPATMSWSLREWLCSRNLLFAVRLPYKILRIFVYTSDGRHRISWKFLLSPALCHPRTLESRERWCCTIESRVRWCCSMVSSFWGWFWYYSRFCPSFWITLLLFRF